MIVSHKSAPAGGPAATPALATVRRLSPGDRRALGLGLVLALALLGWFGFAVSRTVAADRAVTRGAAPAMHTGH